MACTCISCADCGGSGQLWECENGDITKHRCDDMGDLITCSTCRGSGFSEECEECFGADNDDSFDRWLGGT